MAPLTMFDLAVGLAALAVAGIAIYLFLRASSSTSREDEEKPWQFREEDAPSSLYRGSSFEKENLNVPKPQRVLKRTDIEKARSNIRTLTLQSELYSMILKRLFEAEDEGQITNNERVNLSSSYEKDLKRVSEDLNRAELVVSLHELETIREDILKQFEETFNNTQTRIDTILKQLDVEVEKKEIEPKLPPKRRLSVKREPVEEKPVEEIDEEEEKKPRVARPRSEVEEKLAELRNEVLRELEELDKLELET